MEQEGDDKTIASTLFKECPIKILGNSNIVKVSSCKTDPKIEVNGADDILNEIEYLLGVRDGSNEKGSISISSPPQPPMISTKKYRFDHKKYEKEGEAYLREFQQRMKDSFDMESFEKKMKIWAEKFEERFEDKFKDVKIDTLVGKLADEKSLAEMKIISKNAKNEPVTIKINSIKKDIDLGELAPKNEISRKVSIKIPEDALVDMNLEHSKSSVGKVENLKARIKYGELMIDELLKGQHTIKAEFSKLSIKKADVLDLELRYAKNVDISEINTINVKAASSDLSLGKLNNEAMINGRLGELTIKEISPKFDLVDIDLKNADATIHLPDTDFSFYGNMRSCKVDLKNELDLSMKSSFDKVIYQNSKGRSDQMININASFSKIDLN